MHATVIRVKTEVFATPHPEATFVIVAPRTRVSNARQVCVVITYNLIGRI